MYETNINVSMEAKDIMKMMTHFFQPTCLDAPRCAWNFEDACKSTIKTSTLANMRG
jgi:hypothetical protein